MSELRAYPVWDLGTRWFHWINLLCVVTLAGIGLAILNADAVHVPDSGKAKLKTVHVWIGYVFVINLVWRIFWGFVGNRFARWGEILPRGRKYIATLGEYVSAFLAGRPQGYLGHNPAGRLAVTALLLLLGIQAFTGLVLASTDLFYPPFGHWIAQWVAAPGFDPASLLPYSPEMYERAAYEEMRAFRRPFVYIHYYNFLLLAGMVVLHVAAVVVTEVRGDGAIISAMFSGRKVFSRQPIDLDSNSAS